MRPKGKKKISKTNWSYFSFWHFPMWEKTQALSTCSHGLEVQVINYIFLWQKVNIKSYEKKSISFGNISCFFRLLWVWEKRIKKYFHSKDLSKNVSSCRSSKNKLSKFLLTRLLLEDLKTSLKAWRRPYVILRNFVPRGTLWFEQKINWGFSILFLRSYHEPMS